MSTPKWMLYEGKTRLGATYLETEPRIGDVVVYEGRHYSVLFRVLQERHTPALVLAPLSLSIYQLP